MAHGCPSLDAWGHAHGPRPRHPREGQPPRRTRLGGGRPGYRIYRWRAEYGGLKGGQVKRLRELEAENTRLRRAVSDLTLDKMILAEAARGNF
jgi:putative transposase